MSYLALLAGFVLLFFGGEAMLRGAVGVARRFGISEVFVGVAIVGCATSMPELFVSLDAAILGRPSIALGNVIGSNTANLLLILGAGAAIRRIRCRPSALRRDAAMMTLGVVAAAVLVLTGGVDRIAGAILLLALGLYLCLAFRNERAVHAAVGHDAAPGQHDGDVSGWKSVGLVGGGLLALAVGAELLIDGGVQIAEAAGLSERVISISLLAVGTSLPELATAVVAAVRGQSDLAIGNVFGSCVFNIFGILGVTAAAAPMRIDPAEFGPDVGVMGLATGVALLLAMINRGVSRIGGAAMLTLYGLYIVWLYTGPAA